MRKFAMIKLAKRILPNSAKFAMKQLAKRILPDSTIRFAETISSRSNYRHRPLVTSFHGNAGSVLQCCIAYNTYGGYCIPLSFRHRAAVQKIFAGEIYEPRTIQFLMSHCEDGDLVHAGAYFGDFLPALSQAAAPSAKIWAFEPHPESYKCALITTHINGLPNIELINAGLGERQGSLSMTIADASGKSLGGASRIVTKNCNTGEESAINVKIVAIDEVVPTDRKVSIIHLDVEGFEQPALSGALMTIQRCKPIIILETMPEERWLSDNILQLGYRIAGTVHGNTILSIGDVTIPPGSDAK
jgi:FkbM family methyltransferase